KQSGLAPEDISRPMLRRAPSAMQLPPTERTKQLDLSPDVVDRMSPPPSDRLAAAPARTNGERPLTAATAKWEPPPAFQARLADGGRGAAHGAGGSGESADHALRSSRAGACALGDPARHAGRRPRKRAASAGVVARRRRAVAVLALDSPSCAFGAPPVAHED